MTRRDWIFAGALLVGASVLVSAQTGVWVSTGSALTTSGAVTVTSNSASALSVTGGADVGGVIQAGSGNVNLTNSTGNILESAIADGSVYARNAGNETVSGTWSFSAVPTFSVGSLHVAPVSSAIAMRLVGRSSDNQSIWEITDGTQSTAYVTATTTSTGIVFNTGSTARTYTFSGGRINTNTSQPGFLAYNSADDSIVSDTVTVDFDTERYDNASSFSGDTFTAPVTGQYQLCASVEVTTDGTGVHNARIVTTAQTYRIGYFQISTTSVASGCVYADMSASDTAFVQFSNAGSTDTIEGGAGTGTFFSGRLVP